MNLKRLLLLSALLLVAGLAPAQVTSFTYQGRLNDNGAPANGLFDLRFSLYESLVGGGLRGGPITVAPVLVSNGLFTVSLNFGNAFSAVDSPTLAIEVRPNGSAGVYTLLTPRQPVTPAPYAMRALQRGHSRRAGCQRVLEVGRQWGHDAWREFSGHNGQSTIDAEGRFRRNWAFNSNHQFRILRC